MRFKILFISLLMIMVTQLLAQERCGTVQYEKLLELKNPGKEKNLQFENWINQKLSQSATKQLKQQRTGSATYEIPVVVHVIHNGEAIGTGTNISDNQILSQINVLNKDFKRLNTDAGNTPSEFLGAAGSLDIEFILAKQDPYGAPTNGIERVQGTKSVWDINDDATFKALSYWPAEDYYNIWVINFKDYLGYAQFPVSNLITDLNNSSQNRLTDGVIIHYAAFGSNFEGLGTFNLLTDYNHGRTLTHETGHFFGLRHIWGDDGTACSGPDHVDDTPNQGANYSVQCSTSPRQSCTSNDMFMFISPGVSSCGGAVIPSIEIQNIGTSPATAAQLQLKVNGVIVETRDEVLNLPNLAITSVTFNPVSQLSGTANYEFEVLSVNGVADQRASNNYLTISSTIPPSGTLPITEVFNTFPANWSRSNPDNNIQWEIKSTSSNGNAMYVNCWSYENQGAVDQLITPVLDLTGESVALLKFDRAHAMHSLNYQERLRVLVSIVCDFDNTSTEVLNLLGPTLATAPQTSSQFVPNASQWETTSISLNAFVGNKIQIAFEVTNGWGNDVYLDNVVVLTDEIVDLAILSIESPGPVTCLANPAPVIRVKNLGSTLITSFKVVTKVNNQTQPLQTISNISIAPGSEQNFTLNPIPLTSTSSTVLITISEPGGLPDANVNNNTLSMKSLYNDYRDVIPLRQNFNEFYSDQWPVISQGNDATWVPFTTNKSYSLAYMA
ncbi:MAG: choice-of-anchor J domain-containing protein [Flammeovirgaceae bacterium]|nr:choice-of-anchor J domain-containing protein [Flammeovirgaceae bacterium]